MKELISHVTFFRDLSCKKFTIIKRVFPDELLSSWIIRLAIAHLTAPTSFTNMHFKDEYKNNLLWRRDIDIWATPLFLERLAYKSNFPIEILNQATLKSLITKLTFKSHGRGRTPFIIPLVLRTSTRNTFGIRFCPYCWLEDKEPYFRKDWRLTFYTVCLKHRIFMLNQCPECHKALLFFKVFYGEMFTYCYNCGFDLKRSEVEQIHSESSGINLMRQLMEVLNTGFYLFNGNKVEAVSFFNGFRQLNKLIYLKQKNNKVLNHEVLGNRTFSGDYYFGSDYENHLPIKDLYLLYSATMNTLQDKESLNLYFRNNPYCKSLREKDSTSLFWASFVNEVKREEKVL